MRGEPFVYPTALIAAKPTPVQLPLFSRAFAQATYSTITLELLPQERDASRGSLLGSIRIARAFMIHEDGAVHSCSASHHQSVASRVLAEHAGLDEVQ